uniref:Phosphatidic acid phosphatase type 2/haloperoxidase domain-containing protein n=1 Tax=Acrobeloides nanus TaxID=290746 RepID=A0A914EKT5_9BILA
MNKMVVRTFIFYGYFQVAFVLTYILTDLTKISVGRLRPHFLAICQPNVNLTSCQNSEIFVDTYKCLGLNPSKILEARQSFWSRHSSLSMVSSTFAVLYLQCRLHGLLPSQVLLPILQMSIMGMGMLISYSRIYDNMHHWSDVLAGITVGVFVATLITVYVAKLFSTRNQETKSYEERSTTSSISNNNNLVV